MQREIHARMEQETAKPRHLARSLSYVQRAVDATRSNDMEVSPYTHPDMLQSLVIGRLQRCCRLIGMAAPKAEDELRHVLLAPALQCGSAASVHKTSV